VKAPPYGSIYLDGERRVMGDSTMEVIRQYEEAGLSGNKDFHDLPDHITVELEFMSYLVYKAVEAAENGNSAAALEMLEKQERFLDGFLVRWIAPFCAKITERSDNGFYTALADCTATFVRSTRPAGMRAALSEGVLSAS
jgi:TorA maturation chaperone TorD